MTGGSPTSPFDVGGSRATARGILNWTSLPLLFLATPQQGNRVVSGELFLHCWNFLGPDWKMIFDFCPQFGLHWIHTSFPLNNDPSAALCAGCSLLWSHEIKATQKFDKSQVHKSDLEALDNLTMVCCSPMDTFPDVSLSQRGVCRPCTALH